MKKNAERKIVNPFQFGIVIDDNAFCNRMEDFCRKYSKIIAREFFNWKDDIKVLSKKLSTTFRNLSPVVSFDEFQEIKRIDPFMLQWMRSSFQRQKVRNYISTRITDLLSFLL